MTRFVKPREAAKQLNMSQQILRKMDKLGLIKTIRNVNNNHRLYDLDSWELNKLMVNIIIHYAELTAEQQTLLKKYLKEVDKTL